MSLQKETAIIIRLLPYRETSKLVLFYGAERGKFYGLVQGASRLKGRWGGKIDLFNYGEVSYIRKKETEMVTVTEFMAEEGFYPLRENLEKLKLASYFAEIISIISESEPRPIFILFLQSLYYLKERENFPYLKVYFEIILFYLLGIFPVVGSCITCGNKLSSPKLFFSVELGGEVCRKCTKLEKTALYNRANLLKLTELAALQLAELDNIQLTKTQLAEIAIYCQRYLEFHLGSLKTGREI